MSLEIAENAGFCFGVKRAAAETVKLASESLRRIYTYGELIHNPVYCRYLESMGVTVLHTLDEVKAAAATGEPMTLIIRAHGVPLSDIDAFRAMMVKFRNFAFLDMTCPNVARIHDTVIRETDDSTVLFVLGQENHPETLGILGHARGEKHIIRSAKELSSFCKTIENRENSAILLSQTTSSSEEFKKCKKIFKKHFTNSKIFDTICNVTESRQAKSAVIADSADVMLVIGGKNSSNTKELYRICASRCEKTYWIEDTSEVDTLPPFDPALKIGITAGASTPVDLIKEILKLWKK